MIHKLLYSLKNFRPDGKNLRPTLAFYSFSTPEFVRRAHARR